MKEEIKGKEKGGKGILNLLKITSSLPKERLNNRQTQTLIEFLGFKRKSLAINQPLLSKCKSKINNIKHSLRVLLAGVVFLAAFSAISTYVVVRHVSTSTQTLISQSKE